jgi:hypothetical protein
MPLREGTPNHGRQRTLAQTGVALYILGLANQPLRPSAVYRIEQRALEKLRTSMDPCRK